MTLEAIIEQYGYFALFVGTCLEGESFMIAAGFAAHRGYLSLPIVLLVGTAGSFIGDQFWYYLGRRRGIAMIERRPSWQRKANRIRPWLERRRALVIVGSRFAYGLRTVTPVVIGALGVPPRTFLLWNAVGAAVWAIVCGLAGYFFGHAIELMFAQVRHYEVPIIVGVFCLAAIGFIIHTVRERAAAAREAAPTSTPNNHVPIADEKPTEIPH
ncbi:MAG: DedA family protein [Phycisphaerae bacterium]|nr:DedA family protein [Phycisphaerae bacterium]